MNETTENEKPEIDPVVYFCIVILFGAIIYWAIRHIIFYENPPYDPSAEITPLTPEEQEHQLKLFNRDPDAIEKERIKKIVNHAMDAIEERESR